MIARAARPWQPVRLSVWDLFLPLHQAWWVLFGLPLVACLHWLATLLAAYPIALAIGPFGIAVVAMTILIRLLLMPLVIYQLRSSRRAREEAARIQALIGPEEARLKRTYRTDPAALNRELLRVYRKHGINPLAAAGSGLKAGFLAAAIQAPILLAFYWAIQDFGRSGGALHFLWIPSLAAPDALFLLPLLASATTVLLSWLSRRQSAPPSFPVPLTLAVGVGVGMSALFVPAALALYWLTGNLVTIAQQLLLAPRFS